MKKRTPQKRGLFFWGDGRWEKRNGKCEKRMALFQHFANAAQQRVPFLFSRFPPKKAAHVVKVLTKNKGCGLMRVLSKGG